MKKKYVVELTKEERARLRGLISAGVAPARMLNRARVLLKADAGEHAGGGPAPADREIAGMLETSAATAWVGCASASAARGSRRRWSARCPTGCTRGRWTGAPRPG